MHSWMQIIFWCCAGVVIYAYAVYPVIIFVCSRVFGRTRTVPVVSDDHLPVITLLIAAHNEEAVVEQRILNALALDYPAEKMEIVIASDGSDDRTVEIVRKYAHRVRLLNYVERRGKAATLNLAMFVAHGEIVILSDANTSTDSAAARNLVRWFADENVGAVCGKLVLIDSPTGRNVDSLYWRYETFLKKCEGKLGALLGSNGAIYAIRRDLFTPIPPQTIVDDFVIPLLAKVRSGCDIVYDTDAIGFEETAQNVRDEFRRRVRIGAGGFQAISMLWRLLDPWKGWIAFTFLSHKITRWLCPFFLVGSFVTSAALWKVSLIFRALFIAQMVFYTSAIAMACVSAHARIL